MTGRTGLLLALCLIMLVLPAAAAGIVLSGEDARSTIGYQAAAIGTCRGTPGGILLAGADRDETRSFVPAAIDTCHAVAGDILLAGADRDETRSFVPAAIDTCTAIPGTVLLAGTDADLTIGAVQACFVAIPVPVPGVSAAPSDPDCDGIYEDLNANNRLDFADVVLYFQQMQWIAANEPICQFDLNANGRIDFADIVALFNEI